MADLTQDLERREEGPDALAVSGWRRTECRRLTGPDSIRLDNERMSDSRTRQINRERPQPIAVLREEDDDAGIGRRWTSETRLTGSMGRVNSNDTKMIAARLV